MSHFSVAVITKTDTEEEIDSLLLPYEEYGGWDEQKERLKNYLEFYEDEDYDKDEVTHKHGYWQNPNAKWDWCEIGGRFDNEGIKPFTKLKDINMTINKEKYDYYCRYWEVVVERAELKENENKDDFFTFHKVEYFLSRYKTKENYAMYKAKFGTYAMVTPDGKWYECGEMGWFACDNASYETIKAFEEMQYNYIINKNNAEYYLTIVDCHI